MLSTSWLQFFYMHFFSQNHLQTKFQLLLLLSSFLSVLSLQALSGEYMLQLTVPIHFYPMAYISALQGKQIICFQVMLFRPW